VKASFNAWSGDVDDEQIELSHEAGNEYYGEGQPPLRVMFSTRRGGKLGKLPVSGTFP
jgi:hypothetical protein